MRLSAAQIEAIKQESHRFFGPRVGVWLFGSRVDDAAKGGDIKLLRQRGFSMIELIAVLVIMGILAVAALPRFFDINTFESRGFHDQVISTLRYAQKIAIAQRRFVCVSFTSDSITLTSGATAACGTDLTSPTGVSPYVVTSPAAEVTLSGGAAFNFDALGKASAAQSIAISGSTPITVVAETGYVY